MHPSLLPISADVRKRRKKSKINKFNHHTMWEGNIYIIHEGVISFVCVPNLYINEGSTNERLIWHSCPDRDACVKDDRDP
jgi:hypothetical protein